MWRSVYHVSAAAVNGSVQRVLLPRQSRGEIDLTVSVKVQQEQDPISVVSSSLTYPLDFDSRGFPPGLPVSLLPHLHPFYLCTCIRPCTYTPPRCAARTLGRSFRGFALLCNLLVSSQCRVPRTAHLDFINMHALMILIHCTLGIGNPSDSNTRVARQVTPRCASSIEGLTSETGPRSRGESEGASDSGRGKREGERPRSRKAENARGKS